MSINISQILFKCPFLINLKMHGTIMVFYPFCEFKSISKFISFESIMPLSLRKIWFVGIVRFYFRRFTFKNCKKNIFTNDIMEHYAMFFWVLCFLNLSLNIMNLINKIFKVSSLLQQKSTPSLHPSIRSFPFFNLGHHFIKRT